MTIYEDKGNKEGKHIAKNEWWALQGVEVVRIPLPVGDYILNNPKIEDVVDRKLKRGVEIKKLDLLGTYNRCVDTKKDVQELITDVQSEHERFRDELILAKNNGIKLYVLVENESRYADFRKTIWNPSIRCINDLNNWKNPRLFVKKNGKPAYPKAMPGTKLAKICHTMEERYGCKFIFCKPDEAAELIVKILQGEYKDA